jgi:hypothetical protein
VINLSLLGADLAPRNIFADSLLALQPQWFLYQTSYLNNAG